MMQLLMTADTVGGVWTYALDLARALAPYRVEVALATMGALPSQQQKEQAAAAGNVRLFASSYRLEWMEDPWDDVEQAGQWLLELAARVSPDLVHLNNYAHGHLPWGVPTVMVGHSCVLSWWEAVKGETAPESWERYRQVVTRGLQAASVVTAPTQAMLACLQRHYGPLGRACAIVNGREESLYRPQAKQPFILTAGRLWDEAKNVGALERIAPDLSWPVFVAGDGRCPGSADDGQGQDEGPKASQASGLADAPGARWLGRLCPAELAQWYGRAAIYALPARYEPFGLSALEAALSGCALVLGDIASLREVWGDAALFVAPDDTAKLAKTLERLIRDEGLRQEMALRAAARAGLYSLERMAGDYLQLYRLSKQSAAVKA